MAEERSEGATTEGPSVTSTVDAKKRLPRLGDAANVPILVLLLQTSQSSYCYPALCRRPGGRDAQ